MPEPARNRLVVLGLDGLGLSDARRLCQAAHLPGLARIAFDPAACETDSELPELSPVNWTSFFTGRTPGEHGVYGFTRIDPASYHISLTDFDCVRAPTIFHRLGEAGLTSRVVNLPNTFPARPFPGMLVAGFVAPELARACHPPVLAAMLAERGYRLEADTARGRYDHALLLRELHATVEARRAALDLLWNDLAWDLFCLVLTETDRLFHFLYPAAFDELNPLHQAVMELLGCWDKLIQEIWERYDELPEPKRLFVLADHGFTGSVAEVDINAWLGHHGFLRTRGEPEHELDASVIAPGTGAFALDPGRIYLHDRERFARGCLWQREAERAAEAIREGLTGLVHEGRRVIEAVHRGRDLYHGAQAHRAPDLVAVAAPGFDLKAKFDRSEVFGLFGRFGCHTARGALFCDTHGARPSRLAHTGGLVLQHFGIRP